MKRLKYFKKELVLSYYKSRSDNKRGGKISKSSHAAPGQALGYFFQLDRALYWLAASKDYGAKVGIETDDDVTQKEKGKTILEQDKCSKENPFSDRSEGLWKTLKIWVDAITEKKTDIDKTEFYLVTNKQIPEGLATKIGKIGKSETDIQQCINEIKEIGKSPSESIAPFAYAVTSCKEDTLRELLRRIYYSNTESSDGKEFRSTIAACLNISPELPLDDIINDLLGWMHTRVMNFWKKGKPAWITKEEFTYSYIKIISKYNNKLFKERTQNDLVPTLNIDKGEHIGRLFISQLRIISIEDNNEIIDAITDYLCSKHELTRFADEGSVTEKDIDAFEDRLESRWKNISRKFKFRTGKTQQDNDESIGKDIYYETLDHREILVDQQTVEYYLTRGTYHKLADNLIVGWHPNYENELKRRGYK